jgi:hypothetical protein
VKRPPGICVAGRDVRSFGIREHAPKQLVPTGTNVGDELDLKAAIDLLEPFWDELEQRCSRLFGPRGRQPNRYTPDALAQRKTALMRSKKPSSGS